MRVRKDDQRLVSTRVAAETIGVSRVTLWRWARSRLIRPAGMTPTGRLLWDIDDLRRQLADLYDRGAGDD